MKSPVKSQPSIRKSGIIRMVHQSPPHDFTTRRQRLPRAKITPLHTQSYPPPRSSPRVLAPQAAASLQRYSRWSRGCPLPPPTLTSFPTAAGSYFFAIRRGRSQGRSLPPPPPPPPRTPPLPWSSPSATPGADVVPIRRRRRRRSGRPQPPRICKLLSL